MGQPSYKTSAERQVHSNPVRIPGSYDFTQLPHHALRHSTSFMALQIFRFVVASSGLPAAVNDSYPFKCQSPYRGLMRFSLFSMALIIQSGPIWRVNRLHNPFHECLPDELRTLPSLVNPGFLAASLGYWCDASVVLNFFSAVKPVTVITKCSKHPWAHTRPHARK